MKEKKNKKVQELDHFLQKLSLVLYMKGNKNNMNRTPKPFSKRIIKAYKSELLDRVAKEFDKRQALEKELEQVQSTFKIYRRDLINLTSFINQELEKLEQQLMKGGE